MRTTGNLILLALAVALAGCGNSTTPSADDYADAVPDGQMLALGQAGTSSTSGLTQGESAVTDLKTLAANVSTGIDKLVADTHDGILSLVMSVTPTEISKDNLTCKVWEVDNQGTHWRLLSCKADEHQRKYGFLLQGRPATSTAEKDYLAVFAGYGKVLPRVAEEKRGAGIVGWDFDNFNTLTGQDLHGKLAVGYRVAGRVRQFLVGMDKVEGPGNAGQPWTALFRYRRVVGLGGHFVFLTVGDVLTKVAGNLQPGQDGIDEVVRAAIAWDALGAARTAYMACGGTVGAGCVRVVQCWQKNGDQAGDAKVDDGSGSAKWDEVSCPKVDFDVSAPDLSDVTPPGADPGNNGAPGVGEPTPDPKE